MSMKSRFLAMAAMGAALTSGGPDPADYLYNPANRRDNSPKAMAARRKRKKAKRHSRKFNKR